RLADSPRPQRGGGASHFSRCAGTADRRTARSLLHPIRAVTRCRKIGATLCGQSVSGIAGRGPTRRWPDGTGSTDLHPGLGASNPLSGPAPQRDPIHLRLPVNASDTVGARTTASGDSGLAVVSPRDRHLPLSAPFFFS